MKTFDIEILTPYGKYLETKGSYLFIYGINGALGILPNHCDFVTPISISEMKIKDENALETRYAVSGGVMQIKQNKVTLLLDAIEKSDDIDIERALKAKENAEKLLKEKEESDQKHAELALKRAINRLKVGGYQN